jgi:SIR2-like domain
MGEARRSNRLARSPRRAGNPEEGLSQPRDVYVLGAGASYVHGAPLTDGLLPYAFTRSPNRNDMRLSLLRDFLREVFHFTVPRNARGSAWQHVPSLVDVLSVVDVALDRKESLARGFDFERLRRVRSALEFAIFEALEDSLRWRSPGQRVRRSRATKELVERLSPEQAAVISFNYDVIIDIALAMRGRAFDFKRADVETLSGGDHRTIDYGVEFANVEPVAAGQRFQLLKLHGSFNWLRSRVTGNLYFGGMQKAVGILFRTPAQRQAAQLSNLFRQKTIPGRVPEVIDDLEPVLVTPTHLKDLRNSHLARIWRRAEECLRGAERITFIGYSLPGDDLHVKYLFKRAMETRPPGTFPPTIVVVDKGNPRTSQVRANYERFFGKHCVRYHGEGFDAWVKKHS